MNVIVDVQYACDEFELPQEQLLTTWVQTTLENCILERASVGCAMRTFKDNENHEMVRTAHPTLASEDEDLELTIRMVDEREGRHLNETWRQGSGATNVLSFPFECPPGIELALLGDIVICVPVVAREAVEQNKSLQAHWAHLVIHGTLHLLGYDHLEESAATQMEKLEIKILHHLGYPNPYLSLEAL